MTTGPSYFDIQFSLVDRQAGVTNTTNIPLTPCNISQWSQYGDSVIS